MKTRREPPPETHADEPVLFRTGPHWMSQDVLFGLAAMLVIFAALSRFVAPELTRFALIPAVPLLLRLGYELPRYWRFETVLTTGRLVVNVGVVRDVYHIIPVRDMRSVTTRTTRLGRLLGYGGVDIALDATGPDGSPLRTAYSLEYLRDAHGLAEGLRQAMTRVSGSR